ncbi:MAG TPA: glutamine-hydrolyzing GMP synthase, partial [Rhodothermales bacterium]|nr:glutamine-hydrolyzing GMP synthase [Rhodothermales bacterium]
MHQKIVILDFGSQFTQLIARRIRELGVYCEIYPCTKPVHEVEALQASGLVLSGGPNSIYDTGAPQLDPAFLNLYRSDGRLMPILGICYGLQAIAHLEGGSVERAAKREFGRAHLNAASDERLFADMPANAIVWMSHGDHLTALPDGFRVIACTENAPIAAVRSDTKPIWGVQFHPEVAHTPEGKTLFRNFVLDICGCRGDWTASSFVEEKIAEIQKQVGNGHVILGLSGGVDSSVAAVLLHQALGDQLTCIFINNGLLRKGEFSQVQETFRDHFHIRLKAIDASDQFLNELAGITDPEAKRKTIGRVFIEAFERVTHEISDELGLKPTFLAQGTLYPDVIESVSFKGPSVTIKSHHNVGGLPKNLPFQLIEPFRELFKDEVRAVGRFMNVPESI